MTFDYLKTAYAVLDKYDFTEEVKEGKENHMDFYDFYDLIIDNYPAEVERDAFNELTNNEIMDYFLERYPLIWRVEVKYHL